MHIPEYLHKELYERLAPAKDDILLAKNGTTGIAAIVDRNEVFDIYVSLALIRIVNNLVFHHMFCMLLVVHMFRNILITR